MAEENVYLNITAQILKRFMQKTTKSRGGGRPGMENGMYQPYRVRQSIQIFNFYTLFCAHYPQDYSFRGETHDFWECFYVRRGEVSVIGNERVYLLEKGDLIFHQPQELHRFAVKAEEGADVLTFSFDGAGALLEELKGGAFSLSGEQAGLFAPVIKVAESRGLFLPDDSRAYEKKMKRLEAAPMELQQIVCYIELLFLSLHGQKRLEPETDSRSALVFRDAVSYMTEKSGEMPGIEEIARACHTSCTGLQNVFRSYSGLSVHRYLMKLKINTAVKLLGQGRSVTETALELGFQSQSHFSNVFKKETGISPGKSRGDKRQGGI